MNLVNELENDLAFAFFVEKIHSEKIDSKEVVALLNKVREILEPGSADDDLAETVFAAGIAAETTAH